MKENLRKIGEYFKNYLTFVSTMSLDVHKLAGNYAMCRGFLQNIYY